MRQQIAWLSFGGHGEAITSGTTVTNWVQVGPTARTEVTCTLTHSSSVRGERPSEGGGGFQHRYNIGGAGTANQLVVGLANAVSSQTATFDVECSAALVTYDGSGWTTADQVSSTQLAFPGLVVADAGSTYASLEQIELQPLLPAGATDWRILDRNNGCTGFLGIGESPAMEAEKTTAGTLRLDTTRTWVLGSAECSSSPGTAMVVAHADRVSSLRVTLRNNGHQAVAIGYVHSFDFGDAPESYGVAGAYNAPWTNATTLPTATTRVAGPGVTTAISGVVEHGAVAGAGTAVPRLGPSLTFERSPQYSANAGADADNAFVAAPSSLPPTSPGGTVTLAPRCRGGGTVTGWIDWNRNGEFDPGEQSDVRPCTSTNNDGAAVTLTWTVPGDASGGPTYARFVVAGEASELAPTGIVSRGEVEDFAVSALIRKLSVTKTADQVQIPDAGGVVTYTVTVTNVGNAAYTAGDPAWVYDSYAEADDDADLGTPTGAPPGASGVDTTNRFLWWSGALATGASATFTIPMTVSASPGDRIMTNVARVSSTQLTTAQVTAPCAAGSPEETAGVCASSVLYRVDLEVTKLAYLESDSTFSDPLPSGIALAEDTAVVWRYTVSNTGSIALTDIVLTDVASETRTNVDGAVLTETDTVITCDGLPPDTSVTIPTLAAGASLTCQAEGVIGGT